MKTAVNRITAHRPKPKVTPEQARKRRFLDAIPVFDVGIKDAARFYACANMCLNRVYARLSPLDAIHMCSYTNSEYMQPKTVKGISIIWQAAMNMLESDEQLDGLEAEAREWEKMFRSRKDGQRRRENAMEDYRMNVAKI